MFTLYSANTLSNAIANTANIYNLYANSIPSNINLTTFAIANTLPIANGTVLLLTANNGNGSILQAVSLGAVNSGGTGFRALVVPN